MPTGIIRQIRAEGELLHLGIVLRFNLSVRNLLLQENKGGLTMHSIIYPTSKP